MFRKKCSSYVNIYKGCGRVSLQVSIMAMEESRVLVWHRDKLKLSIMSDGFLQAVFDHILGRDVVHKLMQVTHPHTADLAAACRPFLI